MFVLRPGERTEDVIALSLIGDAQGSDGIVEVCRGSAHGVLRRDGAVLHLSAEGPFGLAACDLPSTTTYPHSNRIMSEMLNAVAPPQRWHVRG